MHSRSRRRGRTSGSAPGPTGTSRRGAATRRPAPVPVPLRLASGARPREVRADARIRGRASATPRAGGRRYLGARPRSGPARVRTRLLDRGSSVSGASRTRRRTARSASRRSSAATCGWRGTARCSSPIRRRVANGGGFVSWTTTWSGFCDLEAAPGSDRAARLSQRYRVGRRPLRRDQRVHPRTRPRAVFPRTFAPGTRACWRRVAVAVLGPHVRSETGRRRVVAAGEP